MNSAHTRFDRFTLRGERCWIWLGCRDRHGYGWFREGGTGSKIVRAHRFAFKRWNGDIPPGLVLDHTCGIRGCVNPAHLRAVTQGENVRAGRLGQVTAARLAHQRKEVSYVRKD